MEFDLNDSGDIGNKEKDYCQRLSRGLVTHCNLPLLFDRHHGTKTNVGETGHGQDPPGAEEDSVSGVGRELGDNLLQRLPPYDVGQEEHNSETVSRKEGP